MNLEQIKSITGAKLFGPNVDIESLATDTRQPLAHRLFVALKGEQHDGHQFIEQAIQKGASAVLISDESKLPLGVSALVVPDCTLALGLIAKAHREQYHMPSIAITGSCGKTTVRSMVGHLLSHVGKTLVPQKNYNNHIGLPLTLLDLNASHQFMVLEMGASAIGEIAYLMSIANPTISLITNIHPAHIEGFGSLEGVVKAKSEIYEGLRADATAILNVDSPYAEIFLEKIGSRPVVTFGIKGSAMVKAQSVVEDSRGCSFDLVTPQGTIFIQLAVPGRHHVENALSAVACVTTLNLELEVIKQALESFSGVDGRMRKTDFADGTVLVDDTYNANPGSMQVAVDYLKTCRGERILVMGDMAELGADAKDWHQKLGQLAKQSGIDKLVATGPLSQLAVEAFGQHGQWFKDKRSLMDELLLTNPGATILVKGSRSAQMESVVHDLINSKGEQSCS